MAAKLPSLTIRLLEERDLEPMAHDLAHSPRRIAGRWRERLSGQETTYVAEVDGRFAGSVSCDKREEAPRLLHLFALAVVPPLRNRGIGSALIARVEEEARRRGLDGVYLGVTVDNDPAMRLYERLGYRRRDGPAVGDWRWYGRDGARPDVGARRYRMVKRFHVAGAHSTLGLRSGQAGSGQSALGGSGQA